MPDHPAQPPIGDYAIIGDCLSAALVSRGGSVDWLCWPEFHSPSIFGALLDPGRGGSFRIAPVDPEAESRRRYLGDTNVLETTFRTRTGTVRVVDCMPVTLEAEKRKRLWPDRDLLRIIEGVEGEVELEITCAPRPDYGRVTPILRDRGVLGFYYDHEARALILRSDIPLRLSEEHSLVTGRARIRPGQRAAVHLVQSEQEIAILPALGAEAERQLERSLAWWGEWAARCRYRGPWRE
ncbi:MAG TPA: trehalase-like domain-containing protein, partial [Gemmatimonadales bacterium]|nr:trehalase-like domain-containing protein [Gemmatimonadales bacterium]